MNPSTLSRTAFPLHGENPNRRENRTLPFAAPFRNGERNQPLRFLLVIVITLVATFTWVQKSPADEGLLRGPGKALRAKAEKTGTAAMTQDIIEDLATAPIRFYQHYLSHQWGQTCAYYPSCSNYALLAIRKHGAVLGTVLTFDRLQHETNEGRTSPPIFTGGLTKIYDPLENNDFWWYRKPGSESLTAADTANRTKP
jgi:putative component of membrane protein insertase Oxa1/YidC/SpoIIIJ protein YidD